MKSLYVRIVGMTFFVVLGSFLLAFLLSNLYYQLNLKDYNAQKLMGIVESIASEYERNPALDLQNYLHSVANLNYQLYLVDEQGHGTLYGDAFKDTTLPQGTVQQVQKGHRYDGVLDSKHGWFVTGFFENTLDNSVGVPLHANGHTYALFMRPNIERMFGELRILLAVLFLLTFAISLLMLVIFTRFLVKPIKKLTRATQEIAGGEFDISLDVSRSDEIGELARHFDKMTDELRKLEHMRQEFVSNVSHEIQSPLTSIQGFSLALRTEEMEADERDAYLAIIESESQRLSALSKQLLTLAALDKDSTTPNKAEFRLDEQIRDVVLLLEWQWAEKSLELELDLPEVLIRADRELMHLVWINLLTNSIKFTDVGGTLRVQMEDIGDEVQVRVQDTGIGISPEELARVFERFYKGDKSRNRNRSGTGLGLSIVQKIIRLNGGNVEMQSELGVGTTVLVRLPRL